MQADNEFSRKQWAQDLLEVLIRAGLIIFVVVASVQVFAPFMGLILWGLILAVALYPLHRRLAKVLKGRQGRAATLLVVAALLLIGVPTVMLGSSFAGHIHDAYSVFTNHEVTFKQPPASVADWPVVGKKVHETWSLAANDLPALLEELQPQLRDVSERLLAVGASTAGSVLLFLGSLIIAGIMMAYGEAGSQALGRITCRLAGPVKGEQLQGLSTATIRSVATGVIGVAFIQALLLGLGFMWAGIPAAGLLAIVILLFGIAQLPATIISLPVIAYLWWSGDASTTFNIVITVYLLVAGLADNVLKPVLLGRGVDAPMPVILLGALGGMVAAGIIGLFLGAVVLAVAYELFMDWVAEHEASGEEAPAGAAASGDEPPIGT